MFNKVIKIDVEFQLQYIYRYLMKNPILNEVTEYHYTWDRLGSVE